MKSYVDWFQVRDVNVVAIPYDTPRPEWYFNRVDGVLIQGGGAKMNPYLYQTCLTFIRHSLDLWKTGRRLFPIWGTCLGFEIIVSLVGHVFPLQQFNALKYMKNLTLTKEATAADGRLYRSSGFTPEYRRLLESAPIVEFNHSHGISPQKFRGNIVLHRAFSVTSTAVDRDGRAFVASIEGRGGLPIYGVQGHPERQPVTNAPFLDFFVGELRRAHERRGGVGGDAGGGGLLPLTGVRPKVVVGKCAQYTEHRLQNCFFFKDGSDGGRLGVDRISHQVKELLEDTSAAEAAGVRDE
jgi:gamma-glutamyl hydrolase